MIIEICVFLIALICTFITISYACILYYRRKVKLSWRNLRVLFRNKFAFCSGVLEIALQTYSSDSDIIRVLTESVIKSEKAITPEEYSKADKKISFTLLKMEKLMEKYPLLYDGEKYALIKDSLIILEEKIAFSRQFYNKEVELYNAKVFRLPIRIVSSIFNFRKKNIL